MYFIFKRSLTNVNEGSSLAVVNKGSFSKTITFYKTIVSYLKRKTIVFENELFLKYGIFLIRSFRFLFFLRRFENEKIIFQSVKTIHHYLQHVTCPTKHRFFVFFMLFCRRKGFKVKSRETCKFKNEWIIYINQTTIKYKMK